MIYSVIIRTDSSVMIRNFKTKLEANAYILCRNREQPAPASFELHRIKTEQDEVKESGRY